ncbi:Mbov_0401 family ICE element transposase-like protein [Mesomycoplasma ovipneumoniae]|uniref:Mbov_0401 family ICE element transposase-like protein n=1 Tax=Mesomycoplasma ovipneumoniae TaxID=29562 RepID=UPI0039F55A90
MNKFYNPGFYSSEEKAILLENLIKKIEEEDKKFLEKISKIKGQGLHSKIKRILKSEYGKFQVEVNRYWKQISIGDENGEVIGQKKVIFYSDFFKELVQKGKTITNSLIKKITGLWFEVKYGASISRIFDKVISVGSANLILKRLNVDNEIYNFKTLASNQNYINLAVDDSFHRVIENRKIYKVKNRMLVLYLGKRNGKVYGKTNVLEVRKIGNRTQNIYELAAKIKEIILQIYGKKLDIVVYGDGATWIKTLSKHLGAIYILDKFHLLKKLSDLVSLKNNNSLNHFLFGQKYPKLYQKWLNYFEKKQSNEVVLELRQIMKYLKIESEKHVLLFTKISQKIEEVGEFLRYIISNIEAINQLFSFENASSYTESFVANLVKFNIKIKYSSFSFDRYFNNLKLNHLIKNTNLILI